jgi:hypothetical protein
MRLAALLLALVLAGCAHTHSTVNASAASGSGTTVVGGSVSVSGHGNALAALVLAGMFMAAAADYSRNPYPPARFSDFADWFRGTPPPPPLDASRRVNEQDCTKPIDEAAGNLRCK